MVLKLGLALSERLQWKDQMEEQESRECRWGVPSKEEELLGWTSRPTENNQERAGETEDVHVAFGVTLT